MSSKEDEMSDTHEKEQIKKLLMICGLALEAIKNLSIKFEELPEWQQAAEAIKNLSIKFEELPEWQQAALPENYKLAHTVLLAFGLSLANLLIELGVAERISEDAK